MKAIPQANQQANQRVIVVNDHSYLVGSAMYTQILSLAKNKYRKDKQTAIYAVTKGNVTQMVDEPYESVVELKKAIDKYKCKGFYKVHYYIAV